MGELSLALVIVCIAAAGAALLSVLLLGVATRTREARHPEGRLGLIRDNAVLIGPPVAFLIIVAVIKAFGLDQTASLWMQGAAVVVLFALAASPVARRARARLMSLRRDPPQ